MSSYIGRRRLPAGLPHGPKDLKGIGLADDPNRDGRGTERWGRMIGAAPTATQVAGGRGRGRRGGKTWEILFFHFLTTYAENDKDYKHFLSGRVPKRVIFRVPPL